jgi:HTH-type transcriptional regulator / antitoxin HipB
MEARTMSHLILQTPAQLPQHLKSLRKARKLTQIQVARRLGIKQARYAFIENHPETISTQQLLDLLAVLDVEVLLKPKQAVAAKGSNTHSEEDW